MRLSLSGVVGAPFGVLRTFTADAVRGLFAGADDQPPERFAEPAGDPGLFGADSVSWRVHSDTSMFVGGVRALMLQTLHPLVMAGVAEHSDFRHDPLGRLARTAAFITDTTFGSTAQAEAALANVRRVHKRVRGVAPDGRPYTADDPDLLTWVHCAEVDSFLVAYQRYGSRRLSPGDADQYLSEAAGIARRLGAITVPTTRPELRSYFREMKPELRSGRQAGETLRWLLGPPLPFVARAPYAVIAAAAVGLLPAWARRMLWLFQPPLVDPFLVRPAASILLGAIQWAVPETPAVAAARRRFQSAA